MVSLITGLEHAQGFSGVYKLYLGLTRYFHDEESIGVLCIQWTRISNESHYALTQS